MLTQKRNKKRIQCKNATIEIRNLPEKYKKNEDERKSELVEYAVNIAMIFGKFFFDEEIAVKNKLLVISKSEKMVKEINTKEINFLLMIFYVRSRSFSNYFSPKNP